VRANKTRCTSDLIIIGRHVTRGTKRKLVTYENESHADERDVGNKWEFDRVFIQTPISWLVEDEVSLDPTPPETETDV
jgi:hypothetical protein